MKRISEERLAQIVEAHFGKQADVLLCELEVAQEQLEADQEDLKKLFEDIEHRASYATWSDLKAKYLGKA